MPPAGTEAFSSQGLQFASQPGSLNFVVSVPHAKCRNEEELPIPYGIARYDPKTGKATDREGGKERQYAKRSGGVTFTNISLLDFTSSNAVPPFFDTPASYYNKSRSGVPYPMPNMDVYNLMAQVNPSDYRRVGSNIELVRSKAGQIYGVYDVGQGKMLSEWVRGTGGAYIFSFPEYPSGMVMVVTRMAPSKK